MLRFVLAMLVVISLGEAATACPLGRLRSRAVSVTRKVERVRGGLFARIAVKATAAPCGAAGCPAQKK